MLTRKEAVKFAPLAGLILILMLAFGCKDKAQGPTTADFNEQREAVTARLSKAAQNRKRQAPPAQQPAGPAAVQPRSITNVNDYRLSSSTRSPSKPSGRNRMPPAS